MKPLLFLLALAVFCFSWTRATYIGECTAVAEMASTTPEHIGCSYGECVVLNRHGNPVATDAEAKGNNPLCSLLLTLIPFS